MQVVRYYGIGQVRTEEAADPVCGPGQVLVRVAYAGICGSDLHIFRKGMFMTRTGEIMGHEFSGVVERVGGGAGGLKPGDHVIGDPRVGCGQCGWCRKGDYNLCPGLGFIGEVSPGCFSEYLVMDAGKLLKVPVSVDLKQAALVEPLAVALHIAGRGAIKAGDHVGIAGAGPIGLLTLIAARHMQAARISVVDLVPARLGMAGRMGADRMLDSFPDDGGEPPDVVVEAAGMESALSGSVRWLKPRGRLVMAGIYENRVNVDPNDIVFKELELVGLSACGADDLRQAIDIIAAGLVDVSPVVSHVLPLTSAAEGFAMLAGEDKTACKILLTPRQGG